MGTNLTTKENNAPKTILLPISIIVKGDSQYRFFTERQLIKILIYYSKGKPINALVKFIRVEKSEFCPLKSHTMFSKYFG